MDGVWIRWKGRGDLDQSHISQEDKLTTTDRLPHPHQIFCITDIPINYQDPLPRQPKRNAFISNRFKNLLPPR